jgi:hypothetical protein
MSSYIQYIKIYGSVGSPVRVWEPVVEHQILLNSLTVSGIERWGRVGGRGWVMQIPIIS